MENASKALLIAAAVLIVILLIAFGMRIFGDTATTADGAKDVAGTLSNATGQASDSLTKGPAYKKITSITGTNEDVFKQIKGSDLKTIVSNALTYNSYCKTKDEMIYIGIQASTGSFNSKYFIEFVNEEGNKFYDRTSKLWDNDIVFVKTIQTDDRKLTILCADTEANLNSCK